MATKSTFTMPLILIRSNGETILFNDFESLAVIIYSSKIEVSKTHADRQLISYYIDGERHIRIQDVYNEWIVRDDRGNIVTIEDISEYAPWKSRHQKYLEEKKKKLQHCQDLGLPITNTRKWWRGGSCYRVPHHIAAWRDKYAFDADYRGEKIKSLSKEELPPTQYDDCIRGSLYNRNWKKYRKQQWKS
jgi:hypothetical protein